jgi:hypothetical protein
MNARMFLIAALVVSPSLAAAQTAAPARSRTVDVGGTAGRVGDAAGL